MIAVGGVRLEVSGERCSVRGERFALTARRKPLTVVCIICVAVLSLLFSTQASADDKQWSGNDDASSWGLANNWFPASVPTASDDVIVTTKDANVLISDASKVFNAKSLTVAGRAASTVTVSNFVYGLISPAAKTDYALLIRKDGLVVFQGGAGTVTLQGKFKKTEESIPDEPAFMFGAE